LEPVTPVTASISQNNILALNAQRQIKSVEIKASAFKLLAKSTQIAQAPNTVTTVPGNAQHARKTPTANSAITVRPQQDIARTTPASTLKIVQQTSV
jgi:hypothetical protein